VTPEGALLTKKDFKLVHIVTDYDMMKQQAMLAQLWKNVQEEEEISYY
jgi:hypothetical protein